MRKNLLRALALVMALMLLIPSFALATGDDVLIEDVDAEQYEETFEMGEDTEPAAPERTGDEDDDILPEDVASDDAANSEVEAPVVKEEPTVEAPATEAPATEESVAEKPAEEEPVAEEPVKEEPVAEEPAAEEPATEEPAAEEPAAEEPAEDEDVEAEYVDVPDEVGVTLVDDAVETEEVFFLGAASETSDAMLGVVDAESGVSDEAMDEIAATDVASIGDVGYATLQAAVVAATDGDTIKLEQDITINSDTWVYVNSGSLTIDGNNKTIIIDYSLGPMLYNNVTLKDVTIRCSDQYTAGDIYCIYVLGDGNVTFDNVSVDLGPDSNAPRYGIFIAGNGNVTFDNVSVDLNSDSSAQHYGIYIYGNGDTTLDNVSINLDYGINGKTRWGVYNAGTGTVNIKNSKIDSKYAVSSIGSGSTINITNTDINAWAAVSVNGGSDTEVNVSDSRITSTNYLDDDKNNLFAAFRFKGGSSANNTINVDGSDITIRAEGTAHQALAGNMYTNDSNVVNFKSGKVDFGNNTIFEYNVDLNISGGTFNLNPQEGAGILEDENENLNSTTKKYVVEGFGGFELDDNGNYIVRKPIVSFDADGGKPVPEDQIVDMGTPATQPANPTKEGYTFDGWTLNGVSFDFGTPIEADITLVADWTINQYTITFVDTGDDDNYPTRTMDYDSPLFDPGTPEREGYTFVGWDPAIPETMPAENLTITAKWKAEMHTITFADTGDTAIAPITQEFGSKVTAPANPTWAGYIFIGWVQDIPATMPSHDMYIWGIWQRETYTVTFKDADGKIFSQWWAGYGDMLFDPGMPEREGYTFVGWDPAIPETMPAKDLTFTPKWKADKHTITFINTGDTTIKPITLDYGTKVTAPANPTKLGYTFTGWNTAIPATMPSFDMMIFADWRLNKYTITFANTGDTAIKPITLDYGAKVTAPADPTRKGYTFTGWDVAIPATMPAENLTITAKWKVNQYTITFADTGDTAVKPITLDYGAKVTAPANPTREGYTFGGWDVAIPETMPAEDLTITATWNPVPTDRGSLIATAKNAGATSIKLSWTAVPDVDGYDIFLSQCNHGGETLVTEYVATVGADQKVYTAKGLKKNTFYKMNVRAFVMQDGEKFYIAKSPTAHLATGKYSGSQCNAKAVKLATKSKVSLKVGKTRKIKASVTKSVSSKKLVNHVAKLRYVSSDPSVASVSSSGKIMAVGKGSCVIYCIAPNGVYKTVKVTVK